MANEAMSFMKSIEQLFSWNGKSIGNSRVLSRTDHCMINDGWRQTHVDFVVVYLPPLISYHRPFILEVVKSRNGGGRPFRFFNHLSAHKDFLKIVRQQWESHNTNSMKCIWVVIKSIKIALKKLDKEEF